jgi:hypothetical protein
MLPSARTWPRLALALAYAPSLALALALTIVLVACDGFIGAPGATPHDPWRPSPTSDPRTALGPTAMRRLTQSEIRSALSALLGTDPGADIELLPQDARTPFDNDASTQHASAALIEGAKAVVDRAAERLLADPVERDRVVGCTPSGTADRACMRTFVASFGRLAWRRPLTPEEVERFAAGVEPIAVAQGDFYVGVGVAIRALLQSPRFLYHVEIGEPVEGPAGLVRLTQFELASRLAFLLWGAPPDALLLDTAARGELGSEADVRLVAARMLADGRAPPHIDRLHALWLGYENIQLPPELAARMRLESDALVERVVFDEPGSWLGLFTSEETFVDDVLATHYGLPAPGAPGGTWVSYASSGSERRGILSHGSFLAAVPKFGDTSPTQRGLMIRRRLLCQEVPPPPPDVNVDEPPESVTTSDCKWDRYAAHRVAGSSCEGCHELMDPIGFGLERYDETGALRLHDDGAPECAIEGRGEISGVGAFAGPAELGALISEAGLVDACFVTQLHRFTVGRRERDGEAAWIDAMTQAFRDGDHRLDRLLIEIAASPAFAHRAVE